MHDPRCISLDHDVDRAPVRSPNAKVNAVIRHLRTYRKAPLRAAITHPY